MRTVSVEFLVPSADPDAIFALLCDFERYVEHTDAVREVTVTTIAGPPNGRRVVESEWSVNFRNGVLCWSERDQIDPVGRSIRFAQLTGDFEQFAGDWLVRQAGSDVTVRFAATFDLGMPTLASIIEPIAERTLRENIDTILRGLLGPDLVGLDTTGSISRLAA
ncbi:MAG TPA: SRPBCC family protein [Mycobacteriales bacterium]|nr:SRPBCC family protein [Mycobacteriales bacterium]